MTAAPLPTKETKILILGMADSVHVARWLKNFEDANTSFQLIPTSPHRRLHPEISRMLATNVDISFISRYFSILLWLTDRLPFSRHLSLSLRIRFALLKGDFDHIHLMETQNAGYAFARFKKASPSMKTPPVALTLFGSDLVWFERFPKHRQAIQSLLPFVSRLAVECDRDILLAKKLGFTGSSILKFPVSGGLAKDVLGPSAAFGAEVVSGLAVKGYEDKWGRALLVLEALILIRHELIGRPITFYSATRRVARRIRSANRKYNLGIQYHLKGKLPHEDVLALFRKSALYVGISASDGLPSSFLEAISQGAFAVQSDSSCAAEWISDSVAAQFIKLTDQTSPNEIALVLSDVIKKLDLLDDFRVRNMSYAESSLSQENFRSLTNTFYLEA